MQMRYYQQPVKQQELCRSTAGGSMRQCSITAPAKARAFQLSVAAPLGSRCCPHALREGTEGAGSSLILPSRGPLKAALPAPPTQRTSVVSRGMYEPAADRSDSETATATKSSDRERKIPRSIHEVDNGSILGFGANLAEDHPGFPDDVYKQRRAWIADLARKHRIGDPVPIIEYTDEETEVWRKVMRELKDLFPQHACRQFLQSLPKVQFSEDRIPQLQELSAVLQKETGWTIRPVAGLMHPRDFLAGLAFKHFHSTQYVRHASQPSYTPEPDICHELIGHVPMLAHPAYADLVHAIGVASLGADDKMIWHLTKVYWYTVEFGVVREGDGIKAFGAGILSSYGEMEHMAAGRAKLLPFDPFAKQPKMSYKDGFQKAYFVLESFEDGADKIRALAETIRLPEELRGDASVA